MKLFSVLLTLSMVTLFSCSEDNQTIDPNMSGQIQGDLNPKADPDSDRIDPDSIDYQDGALEQTRDYGDFEELDSALLPRIQANLLVRAGWAKNKAISDCVKMIRKRHMEKYAQGKIVCELSLKTGRWETYRGKILEDNAEGAGRPILGIYLRRNGQNEMTYVDEKVL